MLAVLLYMSQLNVALGLVWISIHCKDLFIYLFIQFPTCLFVGRYVGHKKHFYQKNLDKTKQIQSIANRIRTPITYIHHFRRFK